MRHSTGRASKRKSSMLILEIFMLILAAITFIPIYYLLVSTFKTPEQATLNPLGLPLQPTFQNYIKAWGTMNYPRVFMNNLIITGCSVAGIVIFASMAAYTLSRKQNRLNNAIFYMFLSGIMIPFQMGLVSLYKLIIALHLMDRLPSVILVNISGGVVVAMFLFKTFISTTIPCELEESAFIDGCGVYRTFWQIVFPLLKPVIATVAILNTLNVWNDFMNPLLFLQSREKGVILLEIFRNIGQFSVDWTSLFPMLVLGVLPLMIFYVFMQKYIIKGVAAGALKG